MSTKVVIKDVIGSYVYLREARENQNGEKDYSMQIILPKNHPQVEQIKKFIDEVVKSVTAEMLQGSKYSGLKLVRKATKRKFTELASDVVMSPLLDYLDEEEVFEKKIKGITEIEKLLKKRGIKDYKKIVDSCTEKPDGEVIAVEESDKRAEYIPQIEVKQ